MSRIGYTFETVRLLSLLAIKSHPSSESSSNSPPTQKKTLNNLNSYKYIHIYIYIYIFLFNHSNSSNSFSSCFRPVTRLTTISSSATNHHTMAAAPISTSPNLTTCVYHTDVGIFSLTWSRNVVGRSLHLLHNPSAAVDDDGGNTNLSPSSLSAAPSFHLHIKPFIFWNKHGSKKLKIPTPTSKTIRIFWDLSKAKFGSRPEPQSGYYIAVVVDRQMTLLAGDSPTEAYSKTRALNPRRPQLMVLRREHVYGNKLYTTQATFGGKTRDISIDCRVNGEDPILCFSVDQKRVLQVKHLKWKFRGNERVEIENGFFVHVSWDVYNWLFEDHDEEGYALFMFKFEKIGFEGGEGEEEEFNGLSGKQLLCQQSCGFGFEEKKMKRSSLRSTRSSSSSSSISSASSGCSSVMEWASVEENELKDPCGFSLLVYAWKN